MDLKDILSAIQAVGFPIVIACILLYIHNKTLKELSDNINNLSKGLAEICGFLKGLKHD